MTKWYPQMSWKWAWFVGSGRRIHVTTSGNTTPRYLTKCWPNFRESRAGSMSTSGASATQMGMSHLMQCARHTLAQQIRSSSTNHHGRETRVCHGRIGVSRFVSDYGTRPARRAASRSSLTRLPTTLKPFGALRARRPASTTSPSWLTQISSGWAWLAVPGSSS